MEIYPIFFGQHYFINLYFCRNTYQAYFAFNDWCAKMLYMFDCSQLLDLVNEEERADLNGILLVEPKCILRILSDRLGHKAKGIQEWLARIVEEHSRNREIWLERNNFVPNKHNDVIKEDLSLLQAYPDLIVE